MSSDPSDTTTYGHKVDSYRTVLELPNSGCALDYFPAVAEWVASYQEGNVDLGSMDFSIVYN